MLSWAWGWGTGRGLHKVNDNVILVLSVMQVPGS